MPFTLGMLTKTNTVASSIQFVGSALASKAGATSGNSTIALNSGLTGGISSSVADGDLVIAAFSTQSQLGIDRTLSITDGTNAYTLIGSEIYAGTFYPLNLRVAYKRMSGTPDTSTTFGPTGASTEAGAMAVYVFRGVNSTTPLDVTTVTATGTGLYANPPSITPSTSGSFIVAVGAVAHSAANTTVFTNSELSGFATITTTNVNRSSLGLGHKNDWSSGAFDPVAYGHTATNDTQFAWGAITLALRPA